MSRRVAVRALPERVRVYGALVRFVDVMIGGATVRVTEAEARELAGALDRWRSPAPCGDCQGCRNDDGCYREPLQ